MGRAGLGAAGVAPRDDAELSNPSVRLLALGGLLGVTVIAWFFLWRGAALMSSMTGEGALFDWMMAMMRPAHTGPYALAAALMWIVMMIAMMTPAVLPLVLTFWKLKRGSPAQSARHGLLFSASYLLVWCAFGLLLAFLQWGLHRGAILHTELLTTGPLFAAWLLIAAGIYQLTPLKATCLAHCQTPLAFLLTQWRDGAGGALRMGITHGSYCLGCCWALMLLMFVGGVMSVGWMVLISVFSLLERVLPVSRWSRWVPGLLLIGWGSGNLVSGFFAGAL